MTSTNEGTRLAGYRREVDRQKLGPALLIASSLVLSVRTAQWTPTHSDSSHTLSGIASRAQCLGCEDCPVSPDGSLSGAFRGERRALVRRYR
jgi:hypothetical protein